MGRLPAAKRLLGSASEVCADGKAKRCRQAYVAARELRRGLSQPHSYPK
jgi:hypothetical protein